MRRSTRVAILGLVALAGCGRTGVAEFLDDELGDEGSSDDGSDESTTDESGSSESATEDSTTEDSTDTSSDDQTTTESTSETTGETDESTSETTGETDESTDTSDATNTTDTSDTTDTGGEVCAPEPGDDPCTTCAKQFCCGELEACAVDEDCTCVLDCYTGGGQIGQCFGQCGAFGNQPFQQLADCATTDCSNEC